jgi:hypothetical protein
MTNTTTTTPTTNTDHLDHVDDVNHVGRVDDHHDDPPSDSAHPPNWGHGERCMCVPCIERTEDWLRHRGELIIGRTTNGLLYLAATDDRHGHTADQVRTVEIGD